MTPTELLDAVRDAAPDQVAVARAVRRLARLHLDKSRDRDEALLALGHAIARVGAAAEFVARASMRLERVGPKPATFGAGSGRGASDLVRRMLGSLAADDPVPAVLPRAAIAELIAREPALARTAEEVRALYSERAAFAAARAADVTIAARVREAILDSLRAGSGEARTTAVVSNVGDWSLGYAQNVVRTNATTAYAAGRFREAQAMHREGLIVGLRYDAMPDSRTRPNHAAADGLIAGVDDDIWNRLSPPLGYQCRCVLSPLDDLDVPSQLLRPDGTIRRATTPVGAHGDRDEATGQDLGFGRRPDAASFPLQVGPFRYS